MAPTLCTKIEKFFEQELDGQLKEWIRLISDGQLLDFEQLLRQFVNGVYDKIASALLKAIGPSPCFKQRLKAFGKPLGLHRLKKRKVSLQVGTGSWVEFESYYAYVDKQQQPLESRHVSLLYWGCLEKATPYYYSLAGLTSVVCPSFATAGQLLSFLDIQGCYSRMRKLSVQFGEVGRALGPEALLEQGESLSGKRVAIQLDGGRSRMREYNGLLNAKGQPCFDTPWREPKVFIIQVLDSNGKPERKMSLPFYGATMQNGQECLKQLTAVLIALQAHQAVQVQFIADGARFIWAHIRQALLDAGIAPKKITYTVDYFHAVEHISELVALLPHACQTAGLFEKWKGWLWDGFCYSIRQDFKKILRQAGLALTQEMRTALGYFKKHHDRMQYRKFRYKKLLCGSGLVESAIRRIVNLRFKSASSFWSQANLEQLIFLRCAFLAGRWKFLVGHVARRYALGGTN